MRLRPGLALVLTVASSLVAACGARTSLDLPIGAGGAGGGVTSSTHVASSSHASTGKTTGVTATTTSSGSTTTTGGLSGPVISSSGFSQFDAETSVAIDPKSKKLAAAWIAVGNGPGAASSMGYAFSMDGASWTTPDQVVAPGGRDSSDPVLAVDAAGAFYMAFVAFKRDAMGMPIDMHMYVAKASAGATSFGAPVEVSDPNASVSIYDKPWIAVTSAGTIAVSYAAASNVGYSEEVALSSDGVSWTRSAIAPTNPGTFYNLAFLCADAVTGRLHAALLATDPMATHIDLVAAYSDTQGASWSPPVPIAGLASSGEQVAFDDPTCYARAGKLLVSYGVANGPPLSPDSSESSVAIRLAVVDGGGTVTKRMSVQDPSAGKIFIHPAIAGDASGRLAITYYAGAMDEDPNGSYRVGSLGTDQNISIHPTERYTDPMLATVLRSSAQWLGDYTGLVVDAGTAYTSFVTNEPGPSEIAFTKLKLP